jgi:DNA-binding MarR family transcriptional regulator
VTPDDRERLLRGLSCTNMHLRRAARAVSSFYDQLLAPAGLHGNQLTLLIPVALMPGVTINQLAGRVGLDRTTLARNLKLLQQQALIVVRPGTDQRTRVVELTARGQHAVQQALPLWERAQQQVATALGAADLDHLSRSLATLEELSPNG